LCPARGKPLPLEELLELFRTKLYHVRVHRLSLPCLLDERRRFQFWLLCLWCASRHKLLTLFDEIPALLYLLFTLVGQLFHLRFLFGLVDVQLGTVLLLVLGDSSVDQIGDPREVLRGELLALASLHFFDFLGDVQAVVECVSGLILLTCSPLFSRHPIMPLLLKTFNVPVEVRFARRRSARCGLGRLIWPSP
jgi:hypothetical protein